MNASAAFRDFKNRISYDRGGRVFRHGGPVAIVPDAGVVKATRDGARLWDRGRPAVGLERVRWEEMMPDSRARQRSPETPEYPMPSGDSTGVISPEVRCSRKARQPTRGLDIRGDRRASITCRTILRSRAAFLPRSSSESRCSGRHALTSRLYLGSGHAVSVWNAISSSFSAVCGYRLGLTKTIFAEVFAAAFGPTRPARRLGPF